MDIVGHRHSETQAATAETRPALSQSLLKNHWGSLSTCGSSAFPEYALFPIKFVFSVVPIPAQWPHWFQALLQYPLEGSLWQRGPWPWPGVDDRFAFDRHLSKRVYRNG